MWYIYQALKINDEICEQNDGAQKCHPEKSNLDSKIHKLYKFTNN